MYSKRTMIFSGLYRFQGEIRMIGHKDNNITHYRHHKSSLLSYSKSNNLLCLDIFNSVTKQHNKYSRETKIKLSEILITLLGTSHSGMKEEEERGKSLNNRKKNIYILVRRLTMRLKCLETNMSLLL